MTEKQKRIDEIIKQKGARLEYKGKSKDVYGLPNGNVLLVFGDGFTGENGVEDPGANKNIGTKEGLGHRNLEVSAFLFDKINSSLGIPTQNISVDLENDILEAMRATTLGKGAKFNMDGTQYEIAGLEFISRNRAWGSFLKRNQCAIQGESLIDENGLPFVEVSVKNDEANDPFFAKEQYINRKWITAADFDTAIGYTKQITKFLTQLFARANMELIDMKMEFGKDNQGNIVLADEISPGSLRVLINGKPATKDEIHNKIIHYKATTSAEKTPRPQVAIIMGSDSDLGIMSGAAKMLEKFGIEYEIDLASAHRVPEKAATIAEGAASRGLHAIIAGAGGAAHLPGVLAAVTTVPVIGVPIISATIGGDGLDALLSIVQMPSGIPVATVGLNRADNAGILAAEIIGTSDPKVRAKLQAYKQEMKTTLYEKSELLRKIGYAEYLKQKR